MAPIPCPLASSACSSPRQSGLTCLSGLSFTARSSNSRIYLTTCKATDPSWTLK
ncbi:hypothetical protein DPMN_131253 [Dreissena polymorpha]|uniref:Uncharacterized protein n=1 Tax=Dreissena polymorpha TaxID=45954 RepID=A0A9D4H9A0_DREPO|nr:hypothetical protein DPMN_131253 [Dreissena polymorpha]